MARRRIGVEKIKEVIHERTRQTSAPSPPRPPRYQFNLAGDCWQGDVMYGPAPASLASEIQGEEEAAAG